MAEVDLITSTNLRRRILWVMVYNIEKGQFYFNLGVEVGF